MAGTRYCGFSEEATYGTKVTTATDFVYSDVGEAGLDTPEEQALVYEGISQRVAQTVAPGQYIPEGDIAVPVDGILMGWFTKWLLGTYYNNEQAAGTEIYTHTFRGGNTVKSFTARIGKELLQHTFEGCKISSASLEIPKGEFAKLTMNVVAEKDSKDTILDESAVTVTRTAYFSFIHASVTVGGSPVAVEGLTLDINNNISGEDGVRLGSRFAQNLYEGNREIELSLDMPFEAITQLENFWGGTSPTGPTSIGEKAVVITLTSDTEVITGSGVYYALTFTLPRCIFQGIGQPVSGRERMTQSAKIRALYDTVTLKDIEVTFVTDYFTYSNDAFFRGMAKKSNEVWAVGTKGQIYYSADAGATAFSAQTSGLTGYANKLNAISMYDANNGYAVGNDGKVLHTTDGIAWSDVSPAGVTTDFYGVFAEAAATVYICGAGGAIYKSTDSGATWAAKTSGITTDLYAISGITGLYLAVGASGKILGSADGDTWASKTTGKTCSLYCVSMYDGTPDLHLVGGEDGCVLSSADGTTWADVSISGNTEDVRGISVLSATGAVAVGGNCTVYNTTNAGVAWSAKTTGQTNVEYYGVIAVSASEWWVCGTFESILKTADTGANWTEMTV